jgi:hypothetical protein
MAFLGKKWSPFSVAYGLDLVSELSPESRTAKGFGGNRDQNRLQVAEETSEMTEIPYASLETVCCNKKSRHNDGLSGRIHS